DLVERLRAPDRRHRAEDDRGAGRGGGGPPGACRGERARREEVREGPPHHPCEEFSTGVAGAGNFARNWVGTRRFRPTESRGNCAFSVWTSTCSGRAWS